MTVRDIVETYLRDSGYDGLYYPGECACLLEHLAPCGEMGEQCTPGWRTECIPDMCEFTGDCKFHITNIFAKDKPDVGQEND